MIFLFNLFCPPAYARFMDDWVILAPSRWKLRKAIKAVNQVMFELRVEQHPDKTFIGRIARGFDFLGYWFSPEGLSIAAKTVSRMVDKVVRLYEQGADELRIESYLKRWWQWVRTGVNGVGFTNNPCFGLDFDFGFFRNTRTLFLTSGGCVSDSVTRIIDWIGLCVTFH